MVVVEVYCSVVVSVKKRSKTMRMVVVKAVVVVVSIKGKALLFGRVEGTVTFFIEISLLKK